ncbi:MAG TPA: choice-of-anchor D domain-containing protein [Terriglobales bacterium]|nr:choice-of-anchor D domain-containing protein [Terriglobales bacterium]
MNAWLTRAIGTGFMFLYPVAVSQTVPGQPNTSAALVKITPRSLDFGTRPVGSVSPPETATLANTGTTPLKITDIVTSGIDFAQTNSCGQILAPGATCTIQITFKPAITGPRLATVQVLDSDPSSPQSLVLNGTGR